MGCQRTLQACREKLQDSLPIVPCIRQHSQVNRANYQMMTGLGFENASGNTAVLVPGCSRNARIGTGRACLSNVASSSSAEDSPSALQMMELELGAGAAGASSAAAVRRTPTALHALQGIRLQRLTGP